MIDDMLNIIVDPLFVPEEKFLIEYSKRINKFILIFSEYPSPYNNN